MNKKLSILAIVLIAAAVYFGRGLLPASTDPPDRVSRSAFLLGTAINVTVQDDNVSDDAFAAVFSRTEEIQNLMSINDANYDTTEALEINRNAARGPVEVSPETFLVIQEGLRFGELTGGAFDITVAPLIRLWGMGTEDAAVPGDDAIRSVIEDVDYSRVQLDVDNRTVSLPDRSMGIDVGGIAKGYAADEGARLLREAGIGHAILDYGGDIVTIGGRYDGTPWRIGIQYPDGQRNRYLGILSSRDESVVSSGDYERYFTEDGVRYHHIFDPATGYPARSGLTSVTVVGAEAMTTDALSTAIFVMGLEAGVELLNSLPDYEGIIATKDKRLIVTGGLADRFEVPDDEYELILR